MRSRPRFPTDATTHALSVFIHHLVVLCLSFLQGLSGDDVDAIAGEGEGVAVHLSEPLIRLYSATIS